MSELKTFLEIHAVDRLISSSCLAETSRRFVRSSAEVERVALQAALQAALLPARYQRYQRNLAILSIKQLLLSAPSGSAW